MREEWPASSRTQRSFAVKWRLNRAVRDAIQRRAPMIASGLALGIASIAGADPFPPFFQLSNLLPALGGDGTAGFVALGSGFESLAGLVVSSAGDINGDGIEDLLIATRGLDYGGDTCVVFG